MRKFISGLLVLVLLASMLVVSAAGSSDYAEVTAVQENGKLSVVVTALQDTVSGQLTVSYDEEVLTLEKAQTAGTVSDVRNADGTVTLAYAAEGSNAIAAGQEVATVVLAYTGEEIPTKVTVRLDSFGSHEDLNQTLAALYMGPGLPFTDVPQGAWFCDAVEYTYYSGWFKGVTETIFQPNGTMTRAMFVTLLGRMAGVEENPNAETPFTDVRSGSYYAGYVAWGHASGIVEGTSATTFEPNTRMTREQMATFLYRYARYMGMDTEADPEVLKAFSDADKISSYAKEAMAWAVSCGIVEGTDKGLEPRALSTRAQGAQILMNFSLYVG